MDLIEKEWLERVAIAARVYDDAHGLHTAEHFTKWLYREYGIIFPEEKNDRTETSAGNITAEELR